MAASIENEARESIALWANMSQQTTLASQMTISLTEQVEVDRHDSTRSCTGQVMVGVDKESVSVPIEYEVIAGEDGQAFYRWNSADFGKQVIGTALTAIFMSVIRPKLEARPPDNPTPSE